MLPSGCKVCGLLVDTACLHISNSLICISMDFILFFIFLKNYSLLPVSHLYLWILDSIFSLAVSRCPSLSVSSFLSGALEKRTVFFGWRCKIMGRGRFAPKFKFQKCFCLNYFIYMDIHVAIFIGVE